MSGKTFAKPDEDMVALLEHTLETHHRRLVDAGVEITLLVAYGPVDEDGMTVGPAIKHQGVPALGLTKIVSLEHRVAGLGDAEVLIDGDAWHDMDRRQRIALLDHELTHIQLVKKKKLKSKKPKPGQLVAVKDTVVESKPVLDSAGRPKLRMRPHDHTFGFFDEVAERHGDASFEVQQASKFAHKRGQLYFAGLGLEEAGE